MGKSLLWSVPIEDRPGFRRVVEVNDGDPQFEHDCTELGTRVAFWLQEDPLWFTEDWVWEREEAG